MNPLFLLIAMRFAVGATFLTFAWFNAAAVATTKQPAEHLLAFVSGVVAIACTAFGVYFLAISMDDGVWKSALPPAVPEPDQGPVARNNEEFERRP